MALLSVIAAAEVAVPAIFRTEAEAVLIASTTPLLTVPCRSSVPALAATVPVPDRVVFADTVPNPPNTAGLVTVIPAESVSVPPCSPIVPPVAVWAALMVRLPEGADYSV